MFCIEDQELPRKTGIETWTISLVKLNVIITFLINGMIPTEFFW